MKSFLPVALATLIAAPAFAQAPATNMPPPAVANPHAVIGPGGNVIGADPDPFIRGEIIRDVSKPYR